MKTILHTVLLALLLAACTPTPEAPVKNPAQPDIYPDYADVCIPSNIAPLNFLLRDEVEAVEARAECGSEALVVNARGNEVCFDEEEWQEFLEKAVGKSVQVTVTTLKDGQWTSWHPFTWKVSEDPIDPWLTYRLIEPDYEIYQNLSLRERCLENFDERPISDYGLVGNRCMNCHTYANQNPNLSMLYVRGEGGGAILNRDGKLSKLNIKTEEMASGSVYFAFSPSGRYVVFSTNDIIPAFHAKPEKRLEVFDKTSDVFVADLQTMTILHSPLLADSAVFETFPAFAPDGKSIFFCSAPPTSLPGGLQQMRYSLCRVAFDEQTGRMGESVDTLMGPSRTSDDKCSVCHPRVSPDGRRIIYTVAHYGTFPIWHTETDLQMMNLTTGEVDRMEVANSDKSDTYHSWSSNSRWLVFASKRDDGLYGKPYFCHIDKDGKVEKPFVLPQRNPKFYDNCLKSFNIPELGRGPLPFQAIDVKYAVEGPQEDFTFTKQKQYHK